MEVLQNEDPTFPAASYWEINLNFFPFVPGWTRKEVQVSMFSFQRQESQTL